MPSTSFFTLEPCLTHTILRLRSSAETNRLTRACVFALTEAIHDLARTPQPLILTGNEKFFSAGADLNEIAALTAASPFEFSRMGQALMSTVAGFPARLVRLFTAIAWVEALTSLSHASAASPRQTPSSATAGRRLV
jgi:enoyl-CoA hydratase/carnithine racemase